MISVIPAQWLITTFNSPVAFNRGTDETWYFNPIRRYVLNAAHVQKISQHVEGTSDLASGALYTPLRGDKPLAGKKILVERFRDRGIGDLLFLTGPFAFMQHITGMGVSIYVYAFSDRGVVLNGNPDLAYGTTMLGPTHYDDFPRYDYQWMVGAVTELDQEKDQLNVYDALYRQIGLNPDQVAPRFKRPSITLNPGEAEGFIQFASQQWENHNLDIRKSGYYVVAPTTHSPLRCAPYAFWLNLIRELLGYRPVIVVGKIHEAIPDLDMPLGEFCSRLNEMGPGLINLLSTERPTPLRFIMQLIAKANCVFTLDSGPLYIAQALHTPAISLWGTHDPRVRIGYDPEYMDLAVWNKQYCQNCPCFCFGSFPAHKCPRGESQTQCEVLRSLVPNDVLSMLEKVESRVPYSLGTFNHSQLELSKATP